MAAWAEVFVSTNKIDSASDAIARDGAILLSLLLQQHVPLDTIKNALRVKRTASRARSSVPLSIIR